MRKTPLRRPRRKRPQDGQISGSQTPHMRSRSVSPQPPADASVRPLLESGTATLDDTRLEIATFQLSDLRRRDSEMQVTGSAPPETEPADVIMNESQDVGTVRVAASASGADGPRLSLPLPGSLSPHGHHFSSTMTMTNNRLAAERDININNVAGNLSINKDMPMLVRLKVLLNPISAAFNSYTANERSKCFKNTRVQLLNEIEAWFTGVDQVPIYVLDGIAGIGKSTIAQTVAERAAYLGMLGASFFFTRNEVERMIAKHFFPTIAFHLAHFNETFARRITEAVEHDPESAQKNLLQQLQLLILSPLQNLLAQNDHPILIVIDALDECKDDEAELLLNLLAQHIRHLPHFRILITARPERHIRDILKQDYNHELFHLHDIDDRVVQSDIRLYLSDSLSTEQVQKVFPNRQPPWQPSTKDMDMLCGIAGKLFIIASTAAKFILDDKGAGPDEQLACILDGVSAEDFSGSEQTDVMDKFYIQIIRAAAPTKPTKSWISRYQTVVGAIIVLQTAIPCRALAQLLHVSPSYIEEALVRLHSLVAPSGVGEDLTFRVHHKSFPDFITNEDRIKRSMSHLKVDISNLVPSLLIDARDHHLQLAKACFRLMDHNLKRNMANLSPEEWYEDKTNIPRLSQRLISDELAYAVTHWSSHIQAARSISSEAKEDLNNWASQHILAWLEAMCILDQSDKAYGILEKALATVDANAESWAEQSTLREILSDASRFVLQSGELFKLSPMHIYWSGLPFLPGKTAISATYQEAICTRVIAGIPEQWDSALTAMTGHSDAVNAIAFSPDGSRLASASSDNTVRLWDGKTGGHITTLNGHFKLVTAVAFCPDGSRLASTSYDKTVQLWDAKTGVRIITLNGHSESVDAIAFSPDGSRLASASYDNTLRLWDGKTGAHITTLNGHSEAVYAVAFSPDDSCLASGSDDYTVRLWNAKTGVHITTLEGHSGCIRALAFSPDGSRLASASADQTVWLWDGKSGLHINTLKGHFSWVRGVTFSPDGSKLASASDDRTLRLWDGKTGVHMAVLNGHLEEVNAVAFSRDGSRLASASSDKTVRLWDAQTGGHISTLQGHSDAVNAVTFSPKGSIPVSASSDGTVRLWDVKTGIHITAFHSHSSWIKAVAFSPDGSRLASASDDQTLRLWDAKTGVHIVTLDAYSDSVAFSPDGSRLASTSRDHTIQLWDGQTGVYITTLRGHNNVVYAVAFSPDGSKLASGSGDHTIRLWDGKTGLHLTTLKGHSGSVRAVAFDFDGSRLASAASDNTVRLWDPKTGLHIAILSDRSEEEVNAVAFSPDGSRIALESADGNLRLWDFQRSCYFRFSDSRLDSIDSLAFFPDVSLSPLSPVSINGSSNVGDPDLLRHIPSKAPMYAVLTVRRKHPSLSGLIVVKLLADGTYVTFPICWFPPHINVWTTSLSPDGTLIAVGCEDGRVLLLDISRLSLP